LSAEVTEGIEASKGGLVAGLGGDQPIIAPGVSARHRARAVDFSDQAVSIVEIVARLAACRTTVHMAGGVVF